MEIWIENRLKRTRISQKKIREKAEMLLHFLKMPRTQLSIVLTNDEDIANLNQRYRRKKKATNVLSFPMYENEKFPSKGLILLGDVVLSEETIQREAKALSISFEERFWELFIHGVLHLIGYTHTSDAEENKMNQKTKLLLKQILH